MCCEKTKITSFLVQNMFILFTAMRWHPWAKKSNNIYEIYVDACTEVFA